MNENLCVYLIGTNSAYIRLEINGCRDLALLTVKLTNKLFRHEVRYIVHPARAALMLRQNPALSKRTDGNVAALVSEIESGTSVLLDQSQRVPGIFSSGSDQLSASLPEQFKARISWLVRHGHLHEQLSRQDYQEKAPALATLLDRVTQKPEADLYEIFYTDYDGNRDFSPMVGDDIWLVVKSRNMVGEIIDIDISDNGWDFEYKDKPVENHVLEDIKLTSDIEHIPLRIALTGPRIIECYFTDEEDNLVEQPQIGDNLLFVFRTRNMIGKTVDIDLEDKNCDFEYEGESLSNDTLKNYTVNSGTEKIPLVVMPQSEGA